MTEMDEKLETLRQTVELKREALRLTRALEPVNKKLVESQAK